MRRAYAAVGLLAVALAATVAVAEARGPGSQGQGQGLMTGVQEMNRGGLMGQGMRGMMGRGMAGMMGQGRGPMMGRGTMDCQAAANYDPAAMLEHARAMQAQHAEYLADLNARLAAATTDQQKAVLTARLEHLTIMNGWLESRIPVLEALPADQAEGLLILARHEVQYFRSVTATDPFNQNWVAQRLARAEQRLATLEGN